MNEYEADKRLINVSVDRTWLSIQHTPRVSNRGFVTSEIIKSHQSLLLCTPFRHSKVWSIKEYVLLNVNEWRTHEPMHKKANVFC